MRTLVCCCAIAIVAGGAFGKVPANGMTNSACDAYAGQLDQAMQARIRKDYGTALSIATQVLQKHPNDFRAIYTIGLTKIDESGLGQPGFVGPVAANASFKQGMEDLLSVASNLSSNSACADANGWWSIYNTIGWEYLAADDLPNAKKYLELGYGHWNSLNPKTQLHLTRNLIQVYTAVGDHDKAKQFNDRLVQVGGSDYKLVAALNAAQLSDTRPPVDIHYADAGSAAAMQGLQAALLNANIRAAPPQLVGKSLFGGGKRDGIAYRSSDSTQHVQANQIADAANAYLARTCPAHPKLESNPTFEIVAHVEIWVVLPCRVVAKVGK